MNLDPRNLKTDYMRFMIASVMAQWVFALYSAVDGMFVARGVSEVALSAVNIASPFINFLFSVSLLFAAGTSTVAAIYMGRGEKEKADTVVSQNLVFLIGLAVVVTAFVLLFPEQVASFLGATELTMPYVREYITTVAPFSVCFIVAYAFEILVKTDGYPRYATMAIISGCLIHCLLDYLLVIRLQLGVRGAAIATGSAQLSLVIIYLAHFLGPKASLKFRRFRFDGGQMLRVAKVGLPSGLTEFSAGITIFLFNHMILRYLNEDAIVSYTIIGYVSTIVVMGMAGIAQGAQPMISYFTGKRNGDAVRRLLRYTLVSAMALGALMFGACLAGADVFVGFFISDALAQLRADSAAVLRIYSIAFLVMGVNVVVGGFFTSIERPAESLFISLARGLVTIGAALVLMTAIFGGAGIWWAATVSELMCLVVTAVLFRRYRRQDTLRA